MVTRKWSEISDKKAELVRRDPLARRLEAMLGEETSNSKELREWHDRFGKILKELERKYNLAGPIMMNASVDPPYLWVPADDRPWWARVNWGAGIWDGPRSVAAGPRPGMAPPLPEDEPPLLMFVVDLSRVSTWDLDWLARDLKRAVTVVLKRRPRGHARSDPAELQFLRNKDPKIFARDIQRYDLHMKYGLSYRLIAALEAKARRGQPIPHSPRRQVVGVKVKAESSVEESVKQIYRAIHRTPYRARRGRPPFDHPEPEQYTCPLPGHQGGRGGPACDEQCPTWVTYSQSLSLPSDRMGSGTERLTRSGRPEPR